MLKKTLFFWSDLSWQFYQSNQPVCGKRRIVFGEDGGVRGTEYNY